MANNISAEILFHFGEQGNTGCSEASVSYDLPH